MRKATLCPLVILLVAACNDATPGGPAQQWIRIAEGSWSLQPGGEDSRWCKKVTVEEDTYVTAIRPVHPLGTHHTTLSLADDPNGTVTCEGVGLGPNLIYAAGIGSGELALPPGVAMKLEKGQALVLGLHIYNATGQPLSGTSGLEVRTMPAAEVVHEADLLIAGPFNFMLEPGKSTVRHTCTVEKEQTAFAIFPHMHQLGRHFKTTAMASGQPTVLHDAAYDFEEQYQFPIGPITLRAGDSLTTECTFDNDTGKPVAFGESSDTEMCFTVLYRYPAGGGRYCLANQDMEPSTACAMPGDAGNERGVGRHCTKGGGECTGEAALCLADFLTSAFGNFCTRFCTADTDCGTGASCQGDAQKACIPNACV